MSPGGSQGGPIGAQEAPKGRPGTALGTPGEALGRLGATVPKTKPGDLFFRFKNGPDFRGRREEFSMIFVALSFGFRAVSSASFLLVR